MAFSASVRDSAVAEMNITPLVDVMLVLLGDLHGFRAAGLAAFERKPAAKRPGVNTQAAAAAAECRSGRILSPG